jgi:DNA-binding transcriptional ArsR family regulator
VFAALDSAARRQILMILHFRGSRMTAGEIADRFSCAWPTTTRHLRKLEGAGLVEVERAGREWIYTLNRERLDVVREWLNWFAEPPAMRRYPDEDADERGVDVRRGVAARRTAAAGRRRSRDRIAD